MSDMVEKIIFGAVMAPVCIAGIGTIIGTGNWLRKKFQLGWFFLYCWSTLLLFAAFMLLR